MKKKLLTGIIVFAVAGTAGDAGNTGCRPFEKR